MTPPALLIIVKAKVLESSSSECILSNRGTHRGSMTVITCVSEEVIDGVSFIVASRVYARICRTFVMFHVVSVEVARGEHMMICTNLYCLGRVVCDAN